MALVKVNPNRVASRNLPSIFGALEGFDRFFEDSGWPMASRWAANDSTAIYSPPVDIQHTGEAIIVRAELPGVKREDVELTVHGDTLTLKGSKKMEEAKTEGEGEGKYRYVERRYGEFIRSFSLPETVDESKAKAEFVDGVLTLTLPIAEAAKPKRIEIANGH